MACRNSSTITLHHSAHSAVASLAKGKDLLICISLAQAKVDTESNQNLDITVPTKLSGGNPTSNGVQMSTGGLRKLFSRLTSRYPQKISWNFMF